MIFFKFSFVFLMMNFMLLSVLCDLYGSINAMAENQDGRNIEEEYKIFTDNNENSAIKDEINSTLNSTVVSEENENGGIVEKFNDEKMSEIEDLQIRNDTSNRTARKNRIYLGTNRIVNSKRTNLMKNKMGLLNNANDIRRSLRRSLSGQRSLSHDDIGRIKSDILNSLDFAELPSKYYSNRTPLKRLDNLSEWAPMYHSPPEGKVELKRPRDERNVNDFDTSCNENNDNCQSETRDDLATQDLRYNDKDIDTDQSVISSDSSFGTDNDNRTEIVKEDGIEDKTFNVGPRSHGHQTGPLRQISDKLKHVFPFLSGVGHNVKKFLGPKTKVIDIYPRYDYDSKRGVFHFSEHGAFSLKPKPKPPVHLTPSLHDAPILLGSETDFQSNFPHVKTEIKMVPVPYNVEVEKKVPYYVKVPYDNPVPVHIPQPYAVPVEKIVPYPVRVEVPDPYPVTKYIKKPYNLYVENPVPVEVEQPYPLVKEQLKPYAVETEVHKPYLEHVHNDFPLAVPYDKNVPFPVSGNDHPNLFRDDVDKGIFQSLPHHPISNDLLVSQSSSNVNKLKASHQPAPNMGGMVHSRRRPFVQNNPPMNPVSNQENNFRMKQTNEKNKNYAYYPRENRFPKRAKFTPNNLQNPQVHNSQNGVTKFKGNRGITEAHFIDLMKQEHMKDTMKQNQLLDEALKQNQLHVLQMEALLKQNQELKASLAIPHEQIKQAPLYTSNELYPQFKPIDTNLNHAVQDNFNTPNGQNQFTPMHQYPVQSNIQNNPNHPAQNNIVNNPNQVNQFNQGNSYSNFVHQNVVPNFVHQNVDPNFVHQNVVPPSESEMIDAHLKQLFKNKQQSGVEIMQSQSYSYSTPLSTHFSPTPNYEQASFQFQNTQDSDIGYSQQKNVYDTTSNITNQDSELERLQLEYQILDSLMKNIDESKFKSNESTNKYNDLISNVPKNDVEFIKFSPSESVYLAGTTSNEENSRYTRNEQSNNISETQALPPSTSSWSNVDQPKKIDNYSVYLANVIKDSYLSNNKSYTTTAKNNGIEKTVFDHVFNVAESTHKPTVNLNTERTTKTNYSNKVRKNGNLKKDKVTMNPTYDSYSPYPNKAVPFGKGNVPLDNVDQQIENGGYNLHDIENINRFVSNERENKNSLGYFETVTVGRPVYDHSKTRTETSSNWVPTNAHSIETTTSSQLFNSNGKKYENYQGYYKNPSDSWTFNDTDNLKSNTVINYGKLNDFLDIMANGRPKYETELLKESRTDDGLENSILGDIQKHFDRSSDLEAQSSINIDSTISHEEVAPIINPKEFDQIMKTEEFDKFTNVIKDENNTTQSNEVYNAPVEIIQPIQSSLIISTTTPTVIEQTTKKLETSRRRGSIKARKNTSVNATETPFPEYSNIRRVKTVTSENTISPSYMEEDHKTSTEQYSNVSSTVPTYKSDSEMPNKENGQDIIKKEVTKNSLIREILSDVSLENEILYKDTTEKTSVITPEPFMIERVKKETTSQAPSTSTSAIDIISSTVDPQKNSFTSMFGQHDPSVDMFDLFNTLTSPSKPFVERMRTSEVDSTTSTSSTTMVSSTLSPPIITIPSITNSAPPTSTTAANFTKSKPIRSRGSVKASFMFPEKVDEMDDMMSIWRDLTINHIETTTEALVTINKESKKRQPVKSITINSPIETTVASEFENKTESILNNVINETKSEFLPERKRYTITKRNFTRPARKQIDRTKVRGDSLDNSKPQKVYQKDTHEFRSTRVSTRNTTANNTNITTSTPTPRRVALNTVRRERVKMRNIIKEKMENTTKRYVTNPTKLNGLYNHKNSPNLNERKMKNKERLLSLNKTLNVEPTVISTDLTEDEN